MSVKEARLDLVDKICDGRRLRRARTVFELDDVLTAPMHGFVGSDDYPTRCSRKPWLRGIRVPTLVLNAVNAPFLPRRALPGPSEVSAAVTLEQPREGGHVGFVSGSLPGRIDWLAQRIISFISQSR